jgi:hypothetical protein
MLDQITTAYLTVRHGGLVDNSARPDAPVVAPRPPRRPLHLRTRARLADRLRGIAAALEPRPDTDRPRVRGASPACR